MVPSLDENFGETSQGLAAAIFQGQIWKIRGLLKTSKITRFLKTQMFLFHVNKYDRIFFLVIVTRTNTPGCFWEKQIKSAKVQESSAKSGFRYGSFY